jgi:glycosyltransferase involved in cell wall biosynthesis
VNDIVAEASQQAGEPTSKQIPTVSVVVTLYNEEDNVEPMTRNMISALKEALQNIGFELVLVLNGPLDATPQRAKALALEFPEVTLVELAQNQGYGGGIQAGLKSARGEFVGYTDADEQISASDSASIFHTALAGKYDLVKAIRNQRADGLQRRVISTIYNGLFNLLFGFTSIDINAKPKVFRREAFQRLNLKSRDWFIDAEAMIQAKRLGFSIHEVPIVFAARRHGSSNVRFSTIIEFLKNMWKYHHGEH